MKDVDRGRERSRHRSRDEKEDEESSGKGLEKKEIRNSEERERSRKGENAKERGDRDGVWKEESGREGRERQRVRERERHRESRKQEKDRDLEVDGDYREKDRERYRDGKEKEKRERHRDDRERDGERERHRDDRERDGERIRDRDKDELREREKLKERERKRRDSERGKERDRRETERDREREWKEADEERERKRRRREEDVGRSGERTRERERQREKEPERELERSRDKNRDEEDERERERRKRRKENDSGKVDTKVKDEVEEDDLEQEQRKLDEEMEKRRRRVQEWQELRRRKEEEERKKREDAGEAMEQPANIGKAWTLEGEESDEEDIPKTNDAKSKGETVSRVSAFENGDVVTMDTQEDGAEERVKEDGKQSHGQSTSENVEKVAEDEELDPLDAFMNSMILPEVEKLSNEDALRAEKEKVLKTEDAKPTLTGRQVRKAAKNATGRIIPGDDSASEEEEYVKEEDDMEEDDDEFMKRVKKSKAEKLAVVDHSKIQYGTFRKNFYIEVKEISRMSVEDVASYRKQLELKIRGKDVPRPVKTWNQTGLSSKVLEIIKKLGFEKPMPIQAQALPIIMSGRDCIGIAKTGSGKTLAFVLPMLRHIMDQPPLAAGDGPIGLIMAPTRELVQQIFNDIKKFAKVMGLSCVPVYGGSGVAQQISDLKRGTEIVVCSPGRMIDILCTSAGKITNLRRVTYFVLDEADRMFDMGFEPQITRIIQNTRPDRQTVLFSATFPRQVEVLARKVLSKPVEIQVGGRSVVNKDITQIVEVRAESERFLRLLELLGEWYEKGKILIFVHSQEKCDSLFRDLLKRGYPCLSLHGAKDQTDRESTISDFKSNVCNLLIATSIAARGLDVKELELVANYDVPNHYEDYVHRVGRTGRAGRKGLAVTFISEDEARYAPDLVKALELSEQSVPDDLKKLADDFMAKVNQGTEQAHCSGYGGSGFKFNEEEEEARKAAKKAQAREFGFEEDEDKSDSDSDDDGIRKAGGDLAQAAAAAALAVAAKAGLSVSGSVSLPLAVGQPGIGAAAGKGVPSASVAGVSLPGIQAVMPNITGLPNITAITSSAGIPVMSGMGLPGFGLAAGVSPAMPNEGAARAAALAAALNLQHNLAKIQADAIPEHYEAELEINDFPQHARWKVTHKDSLGPISEWTGAAITTRGQYVPAGKVPAPGERKLYLFIEGPTEASVKKAKTEIKRILEESTAASISLPTGAQPGKYSVL